MTGSRGDAVAGPPRDAATGRTLVAGVGNLFMGDDGFGVEVARRLADAGLPDHVTVADYGTSGMHLAYDLADGYDTAILVDAAPRGERPGTVIVLEVEPGQREQPAAGGAVATGPAAAGPAAAGPAATGPAPGGTAAGATAPDEPAAGEPAAGSPVEATQLLDGHGMQPDLVLGILGMLGAKAPRILVVGCEPASTAYGIGLTEPVAAAVGEAARIVTHLVAGTTASGAGGEAGTGPAPAGAGGEHEGMSHVPRHSG